MKKKKRRRRNLIKIRRRGPENPGGFGAPVSIGMGAYTIEGNMPTFKEYYDVLNNEMDIPSPDDERSFSNLPDWSEVKATIKQFRDKMIDAQTNLPYGLGKQMNPEIIHLFTVLSPSNLIILGKEFVKFTRRDTTNVFDDILKQLEANEKRDD